MKKKNCWLPYYHAEVFNDGTTKPCCKINSSKWSTNIEEYHNIDRSEFESETLPISCNACNVGPLDYSYNKQRMIFWDKMKWSEPEKVSIKSLNINLDNVCASSCIMCSSEHSTTIAALRGENRKIILDIDSITPYLDNLELLHISGGEPLQSPNLVKFCEKLKHTKITWRGEEINRITKTCEYIYTHEEWIYKKYDDIDQLTKDIQDISGRINFVLGNKSEEVTIGTCPSTDDKGEICGAILRINPNILTTYSEIKCRACDTTWTSDKWRLLGRIIESATNKAESSSQNI